MLTTIRFAILSAVILVGQFALTQTPRADEVHAKEVHADEVHWTITGAHSVTFDWRGESKTIRFGLTSAYTETRTSSEVLPRPYSSSGPFQEVVLDNLKPNQIHHYSIGDGPDHTFRTPPELGNSDFRIAAEGDIGSSIHYPGVVPVQNLIAESKPRFVLVLGDLTYGHPEGQRDVDQHFNDVMIWSQDAAYMPAWGNHEWSTPKDDDLRNYKGRFRLPHPQTSDDAPKLGCCGEDWSWFDYGNVRFISYPEPYGSNTYSQWYEAVQNLMDDAESNSKLKFIVTFGHQPPFSSGYHASDLQLREFVGKLASGHPKYVLNLNGHSHDYERTQPFHGLISVTVGTGGATLEQSHTPCLFRECPQPSWSQFRKMHLGFLSLRFTQGRIKGEFICGPAGSGKNDVTCKPGDVIDQFTITASSAKRKKRPGATR